MNRTQKITIAVSAVVVAGLVALAAPSVVTAASWAADRFASTADGQAAAVEVTPTATPDATPTAAAASIDGPPEGYVFVGEGTWIPEGGPGDCAASTWIHIVREDGEPWRALLGGAALVDMGPREFATGEVGYAADGRIATYTVEPGDAPEAIGERFCIANGLMIPTLNGHSGDRAIQPGEVLVLDPEAVPGWEFDYAYDL